MPSHKIGVLFHSPMQENKRLFPQKNEEGVAELGNLGKHKHGGPEAGDPVIGDEAGRCAHGFH